MVDWQSPASLATQAAVFTNFNHALFGLFVYEFAISLPFDWKFVTAKKKLHLPAAVYLANRYLLLFAMIGIIVSLDVSSPINCQVLYTFNQLAGDAAVGLASASLAIRTVAIWNYRWQLVTALTLLGMGHWSLILQGVQLKASWVDGVGCVITETNNKILAAIFIYSMCFDLIIVILTTVKLWPQTTTEARRLGVSKLPLLLFKQGLIFFIVAFVANLIASIFMLMALSPIMTVIFNVPAAVFNTIVACRAVRNLAEYNRKIQAEGSGHGVECSIRGPGDRDISMVTSAAPRIKHWFNSLMGHQERPSRLTVNVSRNCVSNVDPSEDKRPRSDTSTDAYVDLESKGPQM